MSNKFLFENLGDILRPELMESAAEMDKKREEFLDNQKKEAERLADYNRKVAKLNAFMMRSEGNLPSDYDFKKLEMCMHYFEVPKS
jgi:hypothetical protein